MTGLGSFTGKTIGNYDGEFVDSKFHGKGYLIMPNQDEYQGQWVNGKMDDPNGKYSWADGSSYEGEFRDGAVTGNGKFHA